MKKSPLTFALIGAGGIAQTHLQAFAKTNLAKLAAVVDVRLESAKAVAAAMQCKAFKEIGAIPETLGIEAAIVCTPPSTHPEICEQLARRGIHVLCEKPVATDLAAAIKMIETAAEAGTMFTMASKFRYVDDMIYAKQLIASGVLGDILLFENTFAGHVDMTKRWNSNPAVSGGGVLIDNGTHSVDIVRYLLGPIHAIQTIEGRRFQDISVEDTVRIHAKTVHGTLAAMDLSWSINKQTPWYASIYGTQGTVLVGWKESKYKRSVDTDWTVFGTGYDKVQAFTRQLNNFCNAIHGIEPLLITSEDAIASSDAIQQAYESLRKDDWIVLNSLRTQSIRAAS